MLLLVKAPVTVRSDVEMLRECPRRSRTPDWFLRIDEVSNGRWVVVARDRWGREVSRSGGGEEVERMIEECEEYAAATGRGLSDPRQE
jgi:hypothetical protein